MGVPVEKAEVVCPRPEPAHEESDVHIFVTPKVMQTGKVNAIETLPGPRPGKPSAAATLAGAEETPPMSPVEANQDMNNVHVNLTPNVMKTGQVRYAEVNGA